MVLDCPRALCATCGKRVERSLRDDVWRHYSVTDMDCPDGLPVDYLLRSLEERA